MAAGDGDEEVIGEGEDEEVGADLAEAKRLAEHSFASFLSSAIRGAGGGRHGRHGRLPATGRRGGGE